MAIIASLKSDKILQRRHNCSPQFSFPSQTTTKLNYLCRPGIRRQIKFVFFFQGPVVRRRRQSIKSNFSSNLDSLSHRDTNRPPKKCLPSNARTPSFGAVRLTSTSGRSPSPAASPRSTSQPDGISTDTMGMLARARSGSAESNGERRGGWKEKPKIASSTTSLDASAVESVLSACEASDAGNVGMSMFVHCLCRRYIAPSANQSPP